MKELQLWWRGLQKREQQLLSVAAVVCAIGLFYALVWQPLQQNRNSQQLAAQTAEEQLVWLKARLPQLAATPASSGGNLNDKVAQSSRQFDIKVSRMQPKNEQLDLMLEDLPFENLLRWLAHLQTEQGVQLAQLEVSETDSAGVVRVRRLLLE